MPSSCTTACMVMAYIVMAYTVMAHIVMAYIVMAHIVMAQIVVAHIVMAHRRLEHSRPDGRDRPLEAREGLVQRDGMVVWRRREEVGIDFAVGRERQLP